MSRTLSIFLDALRFLAAIMVVAGHFSQRVFTFGWPDATRVAVAAVAVFFVLSGFVISFVVETKEKNLVDYAVARISRLYSVLVPAIILSGLVLIIGLKLDPEYIANFSSAHSNLGALQAHPVIRFFTQSALSLTFLNSLHNHDAYPAMNSPVWSLGFEAPYYALFGIAYFTRGRRRLFLLIAGCLLFGTGILRLFPVWLAGVALHRFTSRHKIPPRWAVPLGVACLAACIAGCFAWPHFDAWCTLSHSRVIDLVLHGKDRAADAYLYYYWGTFTCLLVISVVALEKHAGRILLPLERPIRWLAAHTFSFYLFHFPLLVLIYVACHYDRGSLASNALVFPALLVLCILLSTVTESKKYWWRKVIRGIFARSPVLRPALNAEQ